MIRFAAILLVTFFSIFLSTVPVDADVVYLQTGEAIYGKIVRQEETIVVINQRIVDELQPSADPEYRERTFRIAEVITVVTTCSTERLESLTPELPTGYRDLAEEIAVQKRDPEARDLALRLYLLAARYGNYRVRESCFTGMLPLARTADEQKRIRALAFKVLDGDVAWLANLPKVEPTVTSEAAQQIEAENRILLEALRHMRRGETVKALETLGSQQARTAATRFSDICTHEQITEWASQSEMKTEWLAKTLQLEIRITNPLAARQLADENRSESQTDWSTAVKGQPIVTQPISFETVTEFDLNLAWFRNNAWVAKQN